ncbi:biopolymer transporter ExbD [Bacteroidia bacterium]|nr:biopolymer transporter ExbD [Bacteroidia bacterium]
MARFAKNTVGKVPEINTGSMSDIIFMLLFFFMVITTMRESTLQVRINAAVATEVTKLEKKSLVSHIYVGVPVNSAILGTEPRIQLNDQLAEVRDIPSYILAERQARPESDVPFLTTSLKIDKATKMRIVTQIKQELRQVGAFKISYSTAKGKAITE